jgi:hypothetical protein
MKSLQRGATMRHGARRPNGVLCSAATTPVQAQGNEENVIAHVAARQATFIRMYYR